MDFLLTCRLLPQRHFKISTVGGFCSTPQEQGERRVGRITVICLIRGICIKAWLTLDEALWAGAGCLVEMPSTWAPPCFWWCAQTQHGDIVWPHPQPARNQHCCQPSRAHFQSCIICIKFQFMVRKVSQFSCKKKRFYFL